MAENKTGAMRANASAPGICSATTPCNPKNSAAAGRRQLRTFDSSILSIDGAGPSSRAVARLVPSGRHGHGGAPTGAHGIGGAP